jgi:DNA-binding transcriptional ArsR family regulator
MDHDKEKELRTEIKKLSEKIEELEQIIANFRKPIDQMSDFAGKYIRMIESFVRLGVFPQEEIFEDIKDDISREIIRVLLRRNEMNISQITEAVRQKRGAASRRIIREKLKQLEEKGKVYCVKQKNVSIYSLSEEMMKKWASVLGLFK